VIKLKQKKLNKNQTPLEKIGFISAFRKKKHFIPHQNKSQFWKIKRYNILAVVVTCSDRRVSHNSLFDKAFAALFVIRNAGNLISDIDMGSIRYAVEHLDVKLANCCLGHRMYQLKRLRVSKII
jgi:carbonic anhydrase